MKEAQALNAQQDDRDAPIAFAKVDVRACVRLRIPRTKLCFCLSVTILQFKKALRIAKTSFIMVFIAHLLGCLFTMLIDVESGRDNWLQAYDPEVYEADNIQRYMVALYWAYVP
jgi:hypothetical protein